MQQQAQDLGPHVKELARALTGKLTEAEVAAELAKYLDYGIPLTQAKRDMLRNHGAVAGPKKVSEITTGDGSVDLVCRVVTVNPKEITVRGEKKTIFYGLLGDETGTIPYTAWNDLKLAKGQNLRIRNAYVTQWRDAPQLNLGDRASIEPHAGEIALVPLPPRAPGAAPESYAASTKTVGELRGGLNAVTVTARVTRLEQRQVGEDKKTIWSGEMGDATGKVRFTAWKDFGLALDGVYRLANAYVKAWRGLPDLNLGDSAVVERLPADALPPASEIASRVVPIHELTRVGGGTDVRVKGAVVEVKPGSGLILRCPECTRVLQKRECREHGKVEGIPDLRVKAVLDDGTGALTCFLGKDVTEKLLDKTLEQCQALAKEAMSQDVVQEEIEARVGGRTLEVRGNATSDDFGLMMIATRAQLAASASVVPEAEALLETLQSEVA